MYGTQFQIVDLYRALLDYDGLDACSDVLELWPVRNYFRRIMRAVTATDVYQQGARSTTAG